MDVDFWGCRGGFWPLPEGTRGQRMPSGGGRSQFRVGIFFKLQTITSVYLLLYKSQLYLLVRADEELMLLFLI